MPNKVHLLIISKVIEHLFKVVLLFQCTDKLERDRLILFINKLINNKVGTARNKSNSY